MQKFKDALREEQKRLEEIIATARVNEMTVFVILFFISLSLYLTLYNVKVL